jgi:hypothetical protein
MQYSQIIRKGRVKIKPENNLMKAFTNASISFIFGFLGAKLLHRIWVTRNEHFSKTDSGISLTDMLPPKGGPF